MRKTHGHETRKVTKANHEVTPELRRLSNSMKLDVKICGLTNRDDVRQALDDGADYVGFVLYDDSPRGIKASAMLKILDGVLRPCRAVGVFVNEPRAVVEQVASDAGLFAVQVHGDEAPEDFVGLSVPVWRAVRLTADGAGPAVAAWAAERFVVDAAVPGRYGGTGRTADWSAAASFARECTTMLAGGLTPGNVAEAIRAVRPHGVDTASGVEERPGKKDARAVREFIRAVRAVEMDL